MPAKGRESIFVGDRLLADRDGGRHPVLGLRTLAEFVEDDETLEAVRRIGIDYAQGFLLARPEPLP